MNLFKLLFGSRSRNEASPERTHEVNKVRIGKFFLDHPNKEFSALDINKIFHTTETRKYVSMLRQEGYAIADRYVVRDGHRFKLYRLVK